MLSCLIMILVRISNQQQRQFVCMRLCNMVSILKQREKREELLDGDQFIINLRVKNMVEENRNLLVKNNIVVVDSIHTFKKLSGFILLLFRLKALFREIYLSFLLFTRQYLFITLFCLIMVFIHLFFYLSTHLSTRQLFSTHTIVS